jgi:hypothetical protein
MSLLWLILMEEGLYFAIDLHHSHDLLTRMQFFVRRYFATFLAIHLLDC